MTTEPLIIKALFQQLLNSQRSPFPMQRQSLEAPKEKGIYLILDKASEVLHVGNTPRGQKGIFGRLKDHLHGKSSFSRAYLDGQGVKLRDEHFFKYLVVQDSRQRALLEAYAIGKLCPKHLGTG